MNASGRSKAYTWPYPRHRTFERALRKTAAAWFWPDNIIDPAVAAYIQAEREQHKLEQKPFPLHKYIHHGLSSQAMLFNLVGPLIVRDDLGVLQDVFARQGLAWPEGVASADLEYEDRAVFNEDTGQPTSIDLVLKDESGHPRLFVEAKLVEKEFGGCSVFSNGDCDGRNPARDFSLCYLHHIGRKYWSLLKKHGFLDGPIGTDTTCILTAYYQFFREVLFALEYDGTFVLLRDVRNPTLDCPNPAGRRGLMPFLSGMVPETLRPRIGSISIQQVVKAVEDSGRHPWIVEFQEKYGLV